MAIESGFGFKGRFAALGDRLMYAGAGSWISVNGCRYEAQLRVYDGPTRDGRTRAVQVRAWSFEIESTKDFAGHWTSEKVRELEEVEVEFPFEWAGRGLDAAIQQALRVVERMAR
jgi:hypothetical protein